VLLGNGEGTFLPEARFPAGDNPSALAIADLDGDGHLDRRAAASRRIREKTGASRQ
jgi:VCBS repeat protein